LRAVKHKSYFYAMELQNESRMPLVICRAQSQKDTPEAVPAGDPRQDVGALSSSLWNVEKSKPKS